ncbi:glycosyltransferase family 2 protein [Roseococcus sp. SYP-B2431]|uniref:glycosyltransferase n=1 Tax=Roseococcus sp. SYP-B2431 TaxID=2496640 RepID=UPI0013F4890F|nr:glycosyltransferase [Roseococcus sp. SYP-B2431]
MAECEASILICTRNRAASLARTLHGLAGMPVPAGLSWEVVVVDNGSTDDTQAVIAQFSARLPLRGVVEPRTGLAIARNRSLSASRGRWLLVTDDDCVVAPDWLAVAVGLLRAEPMQLICGRVELGDPLDLPLAIKTSRIRDILAHPGGLWGFLHGANMAFGRCVVERAGGFDPRFGAGSRLRSAEDVDFAYRVLRSGTRIAYEPDLLVHHFHGRRGTRTWYQQVGDHAFGFGAMATKYALRGDGDPMRALYWDMRSTMRLCRSELREWRRIPAKLRGLLGCAQFLRVRHHPDDQAEMGGPK